jgi:hypothetical protein
MIKEKATCIKECLVSGTTNCDATCNADIPVPWYCDKLDTLFNTAQKTMGLQADSDETYAYNNTLYKHETAAGITTTDSLNSKYTKTFRFIIKPYADYSGNSLSRGITDTRVQDTQQSQETAW